MEALSSLFSRALIFLLFIGQAISQDQMGYVFTAEQGVYQPLTGGTFIWEDSVLVDHTVIALPQMTWNGLDVNSMLVSSNGWIRLGSNISAPQQDKNYGFGFVSDESFNAIAFGHILEFSEMGSPAVLYEVTADELIVEYRDVRRIEVEGERLNFQIRVNLTNTNIVLAYGTFQVGFEAPNLRNKPSSSLNSSNLRGIKTHEFAAGIRGSSELSISMYGGKHWTEAVLGSFYYSYCHIDAAMPQDHLVNGARYVFTKVNGAVGCQDPVACNYNELAEFPGNCKYNGCGILEYGCMDELACNFNPNAIYSADTCDYCLHGCTYSDAINYDEEATINAGYCILDSLGISPNHAIPLNFHNGYAMELWSSQSGITLPSPSGSGGRAYYSLQVSEFTVIELTLKGVYHGQDMVMMVHTREGEELEYLTYSDDAISLIPLIELWAEPNVEYIVSIYSYSSNKYANHLLVATVLSNCGETLNVPEEEYCEGSWVIRNQSNQFNGILSWIINETDTLPNISFGTLPLEFGLNSMRLIVDHPYCQIDTTYLVTVYSRPTVVAPSDITVCPGDTVLLEAVSDWPVIWTNTTQSNTPSGWPNGTEVVVSANTNFRATVIDDNNCQRVDNFTVNVNYAVAQSLLEDPYLDGNNLFVDGNANHLWFFNGDTIQGATGSIYTPVVSGFYSVLNSSGSCSAMSDVIYFEYLGLECIQLLQQEPQISIQGQELLSASTYLLQWMLNDTAISGAVDSIYTPLETGYYSLLHSADSCSFLSDPVYFEYIDPLCAPYFDTIPTIEVNQAGDLLVLGSYNFQWYLNGESLADALDSIYTPMSGGNYSVQISIGDCSIVSHDLVYVDPICQILMDTYQDINNDNGTLWTTGEFDVQWYLNGVLIEGATNTIYVAQASGAYSVEFHLGDCIWMSNTIQFIYIHPECDPLFDLSLNLVNEGSVLFAEDGFEIQWLSNGVPIVGATEIAFTLEESGLYSVQYTNGECSVTTDQYFFVYINPDCFPLFNLSLNLTNEGGVLLAQGGNEIQWLSNGAPIVGATEIAFTFEESGWYSVQYTNGECSITTDQYFFEYVNPECFPLYELGASIFNQNGELSVSGGFEIQWKMNGQPIEGANDSLFTPLESAYYSVEYTNGSCTIATPAINFTYYHPDCYPLINAEIEIFNNNDTLAYMGGFEVQWFVDEEPISGATDSIFVPSVNGSYYVQAYNGACEVISNEIEYIQPNCLELYQSNSQIDLNGSVLGIITDFPVQWYFNEMPIDGATSATYIPLETGYYSVERINETCTEISDPVFFEYINPMCIDLDLPQIPQQLCSSMNWEFAFEGDLNEHFYWVINNSDSTENGYISDDQLSVGQNNLLLATNLQDCPLDLESSILLTGGELSLNILSDGIVCLPDYLYISAEGQGGILEWIGGYGNNTNIWLTENTDLVVRVIDDCFISIYDTLHVQVIERPSFESLPTSDFACIGGSYQLQSNLGEDNVWWGPLPDMSIIQPAQDTLLYVTAVNDFGCVATDSLWLQMDNFPNLEILSAEQVCPGEFNYLLQGTSDGEVVWQEGANNTNITISQDSTLYVSATSEGGCVTNDSIMVEVIELPWTELSFSNDTLYAPPASSYQWYLNGAPIFVPDNNWLALVVAGAYTVVMSNELGCEVTSEIFNYNSVDEYGGMDLRMYPNPANSQTTLVWKDGLLDFTIVNSIGEIVAKYDNQKSPFVMSISEWSNGLYYIVLRQDEGTIHLPLIKSE